MRFPYAVLTTLGQVLLLLVKLYEASESPSWISISQCLVFLDQPAEVAAILHRLLGSSEVRIERLDGTRFAPFDKYWIQSRDMKHVHTLQSMLCTSLDAVLLWATGRGSAGISDWL